MGPGYLTCAKLVASAVALAVMLGEAQADDFYLRGDRHLRDKRAGHGDVSLTYQTIHTKGISTQTGIAPSGETDAHALIVDIDYWLTDRISVNAGVPYIFKRYIGPAPHDPALLIPARDARLIDDGTYHRGFPDAYVGVAYLAIDGPFSVEPFFQFSVPTTDYQFFAQSAIGQSLNKYELGTRFSYIPPLDDYFVSLGVSRVFVEKTLGVSIDHFRIDLDLGYYLTPRIAIRGLVHVKQGEGMPTSMGSRSDLFWYHHDQLLKHNYVNVGGGADFAVSENTTLSVSALKMVRAAYVHKMRYAVGVTLSRSF